ncbi:HlyD family secretion protein [Rosenbergiella australiborealis]|uniref:HlyD family secretion protein n=1 Tax=Rosenbergiella australiborealis TaxID=1544696 RepID=A0ABS5T5H9_9GAMM|nr:HlyD family secretion protein [Rosenbergiella australiborealis]MBT0727392.1 HlyD family secretion protein [Rosenbergiella australiborealis]
MKDNELFRKEALYHQRHHWLGKALLLKGIPAWIIISCTILFISIIFIALIKGEYTRRVNVKGEVFSQQQTVNLIAPQQGRVTKNYVKAGDEITKGSPIYELDIGRNTQLGNLSESSKLSIKQQITLTNDIINKLKENKKINIEKLTQQLIEYKKSYNNTQLLVKNSSHGVKDMKESMKNYDEYLKRGLISKEQAYNQRYLFYQQQSSWQSMNSQLIQENLQIINLESEIISTSVDFDNRISEYELKLSEFNRMLAEVEANGTLLITAPVTGKIENMTLTEGQMFSLGDSLAQILPGDQQYYQLMLWLPNHSIPFVNVGDKVNIRYDAYPYEKFGQFSGEITSLSRVPATDSEMMSYKSSHSTAPQQSKEAFYKTIVKLNDQVLYFDNKTLPIGNGMSAEVTLFLEKRPLYQWILSPYYDIKRSLGGPVNG